MYYFNFLTTKHSTGLSEPGGGPDFDISVNPNPTRGADYAHLMTTCPSPGFSDLPTALQHTTALLLLFHD